MCSWLVKIWREMWKRARRAGKKMGGGSGRKSLSDELEGTISYQDPVL